MFAFKTPKKSIRSEALKSEFAASVLAPAHSLLRIMLSVVARSPKLVRNWATWSLVTQFFQEVLSFNAEPAIKRQSGS